MLDWNIIARWISILKKTLRSATRSDSTKERNYRQARFETLECRAAPGSIVIDLAVLGSALGPSSIRNERYEPTFNSESATRATAVNPFLSTNNIAATVFPPTQQSDEALPDTQETNAGLQRRVPSRPSPRQDLAAYDSVFSDSLNIDLRIVLGGVLSDFGLIDANESTDRQVPSLLQQTPAPILNSSGASAIIASGAGLGNGSGGGGGSGPAQRIPANSTSESSAPTALRSAPRVVESESTEKPDSASAVPANSEIVVPVPEIASAASTSVSADADGDGAVSGTDFLLWQRDFGRTAFDLSSDFNNDGKVNGADLGVWSQSFGQSANDLIVAPLTLTTTRLNGLPNHQVNVQYEDRVNSDDTSTRLTFSIVGPNGSSKSAHRVMLEAFRNGSHVGSATIEKGDNTSSVGIDVSLNSGPNSLQLKLTRLDTMQPAPLTPAIRIVRNQLPLPGTSGESLREGGGPKTIVIGKDDDQGDIVTAKIITIPSFIDLFRVAPGSAAGPQISEGEELSGNPVEVVIAPRDVSEDDMDNVVVTLRDREDRAIRYEIPIGIVDNKPVAPLIPVLRDGSQDDEDNISRGGSNGALSFKVDGVGMGSQVTLLRSDSPTSGFSEVSSSTAGDSTVIISDRSFVTTNAIATFFYVARQKDATNSVSDDSDVAGPIFVDRIEPSIKAGMADGSSETILFAGDLVSDDSVLPIPVTTLTNPHLQFTIFDQSFLANRKSVPNVVEINVFIDGVLVTPTPLVRTFISTDPDLKQVELQVTGLAPGKRTATIEATDAAGNMASESFTFFVSEVGKSTRDAPNTPVYSELFFIGARFKGGTGATIDVDQPIPSGLGAQVHIDGANYDVASQVDMRNGTYRLTLDTDLDIASTLTVDDESTPENEASKIAWLRPWQMAFDKTTQTVWFTVEDGGQLGQFDPATGKVDLYDVRLPDTNGDATAFDAHGAFFDFNTHLTPRIWLVYRNKEVNDDAANSDRANTVARVSYFDLAQKQLFTYDFKEATFDNGDNSSESLKGSHAIFVDARGDVWITAEESGALIQLDFDRNPDGSLNGLNSTDGQMLVHWLPKGMANRGSVETHFHIHGVQVVVDERTGQQFVYAVDAGEKEDIPNTTGRLALLLPGSPANPAVAGSAERKDVWFSWNFDLGLNFEKDGVLDQSHRRAHVLFTAIDDNETPGIPEDDMVIIGDPGHGFTGKNGGDGVIRKIDVGSFIGQLFDDSDPPTIRTDLPSAGESRVLSVQIPSLPGAQGLNAAPVQLFADREGKIFSADAQGGVIRFNMDEFENSSPLNLDNLPRNATRRTERATVFTSAISQFQGSLPSETLISMDEAPYVNNSLMATRTSLSSEEFANDRSQVPGIDQYIVAAETERGRAGGGQGLYRSAINATNVFYGSLAQSDHLSTTIFAETARRQMSVVASPALGIALRGRMAFQVLRDGSLVMTGRRDSWILDEQENISKLITGKGNRDFKDIAIDGDVAAVADNAGAVHVFGKNADNQLVHYKYTGAWNAPDAMTSPANWEVVDIYQAPDGNDGMLVGDPVALVDSGDVSVLVTTSKGHLIRYEVGNGIPENLTKNPGLEHRVYASVAVVEHGDKVFAYGTNQQGGLVEYMFDKQVPNGAMSRVIMSRVIRNPDRPAGQVERDTRVFQNVQAVVDGDGTKDIYATDGNSRLVHYRIDGGDANDVYAENVSQIAADTLSDNAVENRTDELGNPTEQKVSVDKQGNDQAFGQFPFQEPFVGRIYSGLTVLVNDQGNQFIYGTDGGNLILFIRGDGGPADWRVANLTNDVYSIHGPDRGGSGQAPANRVPGNGVFGSPSGYIEENNDRHIFQINAEGEVVEYYIIFNEDVPGYIPRFHTQNINLITGKSPTSLLHPKIPS